MTEEEKKTRRREMHREWQRANKEKVAQYQRKYVERHREFIRTYKREWKQNQKKKEIEQ